MKCCLECGKEIIGGDYRKKFCNSSCAAKYNNKRRKKKPPKLCKFCGEELSERRKTYCNNRCQRDYQFEYAKKMVLANRGHLLPGRNKDRLLKRILVSIYGNKCMRCGWAEVNPHTGRTPIQIEHKDGHWENCDFDNLELLCPSCHSLTPTYGGANKGNGRPWRRKYKNRYAKKMSS